MVAKWTKLKIIPFDDSQLQPFGIILDDTETVANAIVTSGEAALVVIEQAITIISQLQQGPAFLLIETLKEVRSLFEGLLDLGLGICYILPNESNNRSLEECFGLLANSVQDTLDDDRPITGQGQENVFILTFAMRGFNFASLIELYNKLRALFTTLPDLSSMAEYQALLDQPVEDIPPGIFKGDYPNWSSKRFIDEFPDLRESIEDIVLELDNLIDTLGLKYQLLTDIIRVLRIKLTAIDSIISQLISIIEFLELLIDGDSFLVHLIAGDYTQAELASEIRKAGNTLPSSGVDNVGTLISMSMVAPPQTDDSVNIIEQLFRSEDITDGELQSLLGVEDAQGI